MKAAHIEAKPSPAVRVETTNRAMMEMSSENIRMVYHHPAINFRAEPPHKELAKAVVNLDILSIF
eukprot:CAMPEP_0194278074 /NCGR_PEP_ID=MMETSP0169-20130528/10220_1 /TAXON_ID=218684 /ORGANISM="Corethron pennatum, Strain L29A3" /LENGTH=64 /DNA_ID=CAMNT_0039022185 /DNA_START=391 /DNA_END=585 /DNA_ORIENTATION=-